MAYEPFFLDKNNFNNAFKSSKSKYFFSSECNYIRKDLNFNMEKSICLRFAKYYDHNNYITLFLNANIL